jgi:hypothetical protein
MSTLEDLIDPRKEIVNEWRAFRTGLGIETNLLHRLLHFKYRFDKSIRLNETIYHIHRDEDESDVYERIRKQASSSPRVIRYVLTLVVHHIQSAHLTTLAVVTRGEARFTLFTGLEKHREISSTLNVDFVFNNHRNDATDNAYFVFEFMRRFLRGDFEMRDTLFTQTDPPSPSATAMALRITQELLYFVHIKESLVTYYNEITRLLDSLETSQDPITVRRAIELNKQRFFRSTESILNEEPVVEQIELDAFLALAWMNPLEDPIKSEPKTANALFIEMLALMQFLQGVVVRPISLRVGQEEAYSRDDVKEHIRHLRYRLIAHIDALNVPPIEERFKEELGFNQSDFRHLVDQKFITYNLMQRYLGPSTNPNVQRLSPHTVSTLLKRKEIQLTKTLLTFFVMAGKSVESPNAHYYALMILLQSPGGGGENEMVCARTLYVPTITEKEGIQMQANANLLLRLANLRCPRRQIDGHYTLNHDEYFYTSWYTLLLIQKIEARLANEENPASFDWIGLVPLLIDAITLRELHELYSHILRDAQIAILALVLTPVITIEETSNEEGIISLDRPFGLYSSLSDLAKLALDNEYIVDNIISDVVALTMSKNNTRSCYTFETTYWGSLAMRKKQVFRKRHDIFMSASPRLILMPINQEDYHWALAIINLVTKEVSYYSSLAQDEYFEETFIPLMRNFLAFQTPGTQYRFVRAKGALQESCSVDCALFVLNKIQELCGSQTLFTRESVGKLLREKIVATIKEDASIINLLAYDICTYYVNAQTESTYRRQYLSLLKKILSSLDLYSDKSIRGLLTRLRDLKQCEKATDIITLFDETLRSVKQGEIVKRKRSEEGESETEKQKTRKCVAPVILTAEEQERENLLIEQWAEQLLAMHEGVTQPYTVFRRENDAILTTLFEDYIREKDLPDVLNSIVTLFYLSPPPTKETLIVELRATLNCYRRDKVKKVIVKCRLCSDLIARVEGDTHLDCALCLLKQR